MTFGKRNLLTSHAALALCVAGPSTSEMQSVHAQLRMQEMKEQTIPMVALEPANDEATENPGAIDDLFIPLRSHRPPAGLHRLMQVSNSYLTKLDKLPAVRVPWKVPHGRSRG